LHIFALGGNLSLGFDHFIGRVKMAETIAKVQRYSVDVSNQAGEGARILEALREGKANLIALWGYPLGAGDTARIELVPRDAAALKTAARKAKVKLNRQPAAFHVTGRDRIGALAEALGKLAEKGINVHAVQGVSAGSKYGALIEVAAADVRKAAKALGA
jgi:hypothetical protein